MNATGKMKSLIQLIVLARIKKEGKTIMINSINDREVFRMLPDTTLEDKVWEYMFLHKRAELKTAIMDFQSCLYAESEEELSAIERLDNGRAE